LISLISPIRNRAVKEVAPTFFRERGKPGAHQAYLLVLIGFSKKIPAIGDIRAFCAPPQRRDAASPGRSVFQ
jgi:hypothetical protein